MKIPTTLALFVLAGSLANATRTYLPPEIDWSVPLAESLDSADLAVTLLADAPQPDSMEPEAANVVKYVSPEGPLAPDAAPLTAWIELFHER